MADKKDPMEIEINYKETEGLAGAKSDKYLADAILIIRDNMPSVYIKKDDIQHPKVIGADVGEDDDNREEKRDKAGLQFLSILSLEAQQRADLREEIRKNERAAEEIKKKIESRNKLDRHLVPVLESVKPMAPSADDAAADADADDYDDEEYEVD